MVGLMDWLKQNLAKKVILHMMLPRCWSLDTITSPGSPKFCAISHAIRMQTAGHFYDIISI
jgi:hypothetical protein